MISDAHLSANMVVGHTLLSVERWTLGSNLYIGGEIDNEDLRTTSRLRDDSDPIGTELLYHYEAQHCQHL
jgi:hypothetical protein